jgi:hypothetical protein
MIKKKEMKTICGLLLLVLCGWMSSAIAGQKAQLFCLESNPYKAGDCVKFKIQIKISNESDTGKQGANGIFAISDNNKIAYWTEDNGWAPYADIEIIKPARAGLKALDENREYEVFIGNQEGLCNLSNGHSFNLYAWHASLGEFQIKKGRAFVKKFALEDWQVENYWNSILFSQSVIRNKGGLVYTVSCNKKP